MPALCLLMLDTVLPCATRFLSHRQCLQVANSTEDRLPLPLALPRETHWAIQGSADAANQSPSGNHLFNTKIKKDDIMNIPFIKQIGDISVLQL